MWNRAAPQLFSAVLLSPTLTERPRESLLPIHKSIKAFLLLLWWGSYSLFKLLLWRERRSLHWVYYCKLCYWSYATSCSCFLWLSRPMAVSKAFFPSSIYFAQFFQGLPTAFSYLFQLSLMLGVHPKPGHWFASFVFRYILMRGVYGGWSCLDTRNDGHGTNIRARWMYWHMLVGACKQYISRYIVIHQ